MRICSARITPPVFEALLEGEKIRSTSVQLNKSCSSEPSGSNVPVAATRLSSALSKAQRSAHNHHSKLSRESSVDRLTREESHLRFASHKS